ncbi:nucleobase:cation symporter-1, NCS1 family, partial [Tremellales sp. Uapishka_1]
MFDRGAILTKLQVPQRKEEADVWKQSVWLNRDNVPLPPNRRNWGAWSFVGYWCATGINISGWTGGSSLLSLGLSVGEAMAVVVIGQCLVAAAVVLTGLVGAEWHVGFPMWNRMTWGMKGSVFPLLNRIALSFTWSATWFGGQVMKTLLGSMFPSIYNMHNPFPATTAMDGADFLCFMLFLLISLPLLYVPPEHFRIPFLFTTVTSTVATFALFIWSLSRAHGAGPLVGSNAMEIVGVEKAYGTALGWAMVYGISSQMGSICAGILNMSDYTRFATRPGDQIISQAVIVPVMGTLTCLIGIVCTSVGAEFYPDEGLLWNPYSLLTAIQKHGGNGARAAVFFASLAFLISQLGINIAGNAVSGGIDLASLAPKYINIRRGEYITTLMALPMCPWALVSGATVYISVMGGYATFLAPMTGIMVADYCLVRKRKMKLSSLYSCTPDSIYYYYKGFNWRAVVSWACGVGPLFPGFIASVSTVTVPIGVTHLYQLCWPLGFTISCFVHWGLCIVFPPDGLGEVDEYDIFGTFGEANAPIMRGSMGDAQDLENSPDLLVRVVKANAAREEIDEKDGSASGDFDNKDEFTSVVAVPMRE